MISTVSSKTLRDGLSAQASHGVGVVVATLIRVPVPETRAATIRAVADAFRLADRVLVLAGAGFSAGSLCADGTTLPDYRSTHSFAETWPTLAARGLSYRSIATPAFFERDPATAWGFYATRMAMYRAVGAPLVRIARDMSPPLIPPPSPPPSSSSPLPRPPVNLLPLPIHHYPSRSLRLRNHPS